MARHKFIRRNHDKYKRLGGRRKKLVWRRQKGRHGKMREGRKGYPASPKIGMKKPEVKKAMVIENMKQLIAMKGESIIIARIGKKKRKELEIKAKELGVKIINT